MKIYWTRSLEDWQEDLSILSSKLDMIVHYPCIQTKIIPYDSKKLLITDKTIAIYASPKTVKYISENKSLLTQLNKVKAHYTVGEKTLGALKKIGLEATSIKWKANIKSLANFLNNNLDADANIINLGPIKRSVNLNDLVKVACQNIDLYKTESIFADRQKRSFTPEEKNTLITQMNGIVSFASPSAVKGFVQDTKKESLTHLKAVCIGETTLSEAGKYFKECYISKEASVESLLEKSISIKGFEND